MAAAAFAAGGHHSLDDEDFYEYNPHPYQGGYDIALTYGAPLPPSAAICYPLSAPHPSSPSPSPSPSSPPPTAIDIFADSQPEPDTSAEPQSEPYTPAEPQPDPYTPADPQPEPYASDPAGYWPPWALTEPETHLPAYDGPEWRPWRRAATYLFGYSEGYGERWAGTDSYGIPIYANKTSGDRPLVVEVEPATEHKLDYYNSQGQQLDIVPYVTSERWEEVEHNEYQETRYDEVYGEQLGPPQGWCSSPYEERMDTGHFYGAPQYGYNMHRGEMSLHVQLEPSEVTMTQKLSYNGDNRDYTTSEVNRYSSSYGEPLEPFVPTWEQNQSYYGVYEQEAPPEPQWPFSSNSEQDYDGDAFGSHRYTHASHHHEQTLSVQLEPFKPTWSENPIYHEMFVDEISPESHQVDDPCEETTRFWPF